MTFKLKIHQGARSDLRQIGRWISEYSGPVVAKRKLSGIRDTIFSLPAFPFRGNLQPDVGSGFRAIPSGDQAVITFHVDESEGRLTILVVSYAGQDWEGRTKGRL